MNTLLAGATTCFELPSTPVLDSCSIRLIHPPPPRHLQHLPYNSARLLVILTGGIYSEISVPRVLINSLLVHHRESLLKSLVQVSRTCTYTRVYVAATSITWCGLHTFASYSERISYRSALRSLVHFRGNLGKLVEHERRA